MRCFDFYEDYVLTFPYCSLRSFLGARKCSEIEMALSENITLFVHYVPVLENR